MNRIQKKCFIASTGVHLLLVVILFVGPAFLSAPKQADSIQDLNFIPTKLVDSLVSGGGSPRQAAGPPPEPPPARSTPAPEKVKEPDPPKDTVRDPKPTKSDPESLEVTKKPKLSRENLTLVNRKQNTTKSTKKSSVDAEQQRLADARRQASELISRTANNIARGTAGATKVDDPEGPGGGGEPYAPYEAWVRDVYERAWVRPDDTQTDDAITKVSVTIGKDGHVVDSKIIKRSGDAPMDASVQRTLDRVTTVGRPFPEGAKDSERTYIIPFNMKKLGRA
jgi:outer membrane biosynthesis protein TonB